ncbi:MAG: tetratricopeptide repeat protein, partial [Planctomycetota bacterium]
KLESALARSDKRIRLLETAYEHYEKCRYLEALKGFQEALRTFREGENPGLLASTLSSMGTIYRSLGQFKKALPNLERALAMHRKAGDRGREIKLLIEVWGIYRETGPKEKTVSAWRSILRLLAALEGQPGSEISLINLYHTLGKYDKALILQKKVLARAREEKDKSSEAAALGGLYTLYKALGRREEIRRCLHDALTLW